MSLNFEPGFYTKVRIDDQGSIIDVDNLNPDDIPGHKHTIDDLDSIELTNKISDILANFFANNNDTVVKFQYDKLTHTVSADIETDEQTLIKNEYGQLTSLVTVDENGTPLNNTPCASHTHTASQIEDFEDAVKALFDGYSKNINISLADYIDNSTIKINQYGQLTAVRTALEKHTHLMKDIIDYEPPEVAVKQPMSNLGSPDEVAYDDGVINFENLNIGYSILALSKYLKDVTNKNITNLSKRIDALSIDNDNTGVALLTIHYSAISNMLYDLNTQLTRKVYYAPSVDLTLDFIPYTYGTIKLFHNKKEICSADIENLNVKDAVAERFSVENTYMKGNFLAKILKINVADLLLTTEGFHQFQVTFEVDEKQDSTNIISLYTTPKKSFEYEITDTTMFHEIRGKKYYDWPKQYSYKVEIKNYPNSRFINDAAGFIDGVITGVSAQKDLTVVIPDLFETSKVDITFESEEEHSESFLYKHLIQSNGCSIVNDVLVPAGAGATSRYDVPGSRNFNALLIYGELPKDCIVRVLKGSNTCQSSVKADRKTNTAGLISIDDTQRILTFVNVYDDGLSDMIFEIETSKPVNLSQLILTPIVI